MITIPVENLPSQRLTIDLENQNWTFWIYYNSREDCFYFDLLIDDEFQAKGLKIVTTVNLVHALQLLEGGLICLNTTNESPVMGQFGQSANLFYISRDELIEIGLPNE